MVIRCWRLSHEGATATDVFSGRGASLVGGRWTSPGHEAVYAASSKSLALLESLAINSAVAMEPQLSRAKYLVAIRISFSKDSVVSLHEPAGNRPVKELRQIGDDWLRRSETPVLEVPSSVIWGERVYVINPRHDLSGLTIDAGEPLTIGNPFADLIELIRRVYGNGDQQQHDLFICHASEDKATVVRPIAEGLKTAGITVWIDEAQLKVGDSITEKVNGGLERSRYVLVILTRTFLRKSWPKKELYAALNMEASDGTKRVLPLLVGSDDDVVAIRRELPLLHDKVYVRWRDETDKGEVVRLLCDAIF